MTYIPPASALAAYRDGRSNDALSLAQTILEADPMAAEAHLCIGLVHLRNNAGAEAANALRKAAGCRSFDWLLGQMQRDFAARGRPPLSRDTAQRLGAMLKSGLGPLGPVMPPEARRADHPFVNVVGTSYVRSFGGNTAFFPLFIGMGPTTNFLTEDSAAVTRRKLEENLRRVDPARDTILILGSDAYYQATNHLKTRDTEAAEANANDLAVMDRVAERHEGLLAEARQIITGRLFLVCSTPTQSDLMTALAKRLNEGLKVACEKTGTTYLDWWDVLADPVTQKLKDEYCVNAYPGDVHFTLEATALFIDLLRAEGVFDETVPATATYDWTHVFECEVNRNERTRIWCEPAITPNNAFKSSKIASSHFGQRVADFLIAIASQNPESNLAMINVRDGLMPTLIPAAIQSGCVALTDTEDNRRAGQMALDFYGRSDVALRRFDDPDAPGLLRNVFGQVLICIHPDTTEADEARANEAIRRIAGAGSLMIATPFPDRLDRLQLGGRKIVNTMELANRHLPEAWRTYTVAIAR